MSLPSPPAKMAPKIIVLGSISGQLQTAFTKLSALHAKQSFSLALVAGNLFSEDDEAVTDLLAGKITVPLPTYFTVGSTPLPKSIVEKIENDEEICPNLHYLGKRSTTKTSEGAKIVTLGGQLDTSVIGGLSKEQILPFHTTGDAKALHGANSADILLTSAWPESIRKGSQVKLVDGTTDPKGEEHIAELCSALKPRYHFSSSDFFYEREPFFHRPTQDDPDAHSLTRFISMAPFGNLNKQKALYAFTLQPLVDLKAPLPPGATATPLMRGVKRQALEPQPYARYADTDRAYPKRGRGGRGQRFVPKTTPQTCFFCLSNPEVSTHLVASIGEDSYLTIAKGPLTTASTNEGLGIKFPSHALIIPLSHSPTIALIPEEDVRARTFTEMMKFKNALQNMVAELSNNKLGAVTYEISTAGGVHTHWQFLPVPVDIIRKGLVEAAFRVEAENQREHLPAFEVRDPGIGLNDGDFFRAWIWAPAQVKSESAQEESDNEEDNDTKEQTMKQPEQYPSGHPLHSIPTVNKCLTLPFDEQVRFNLQFGRTVLAKLLGLENRIQWRDCAQTEAEEVTDIAAFKAAFKDFDFTIEA